MSVRNAVQWWADRHRRGAEARHGELGVDSLCSDSCIRSVAQEELVWEDMVKLSRRAVLAAGTGLTISAVLRIPAALAEPGSDRIEKLLARMTLEEKFGQLNMLFDAIRPKPALMAGLFDPASGRQRDEQMAAVRAGQVGSLIEGTGGGDGRAIQNAALESRLGIPVLFGADIIHGLRTIFPIPLGLAASFEPGLAEKSSAVAARELNAVGLHWTFAPMVDVARDQRWGRVAEGSGEDVYLNCVFGAATVRGFQGKSLSAPTSALATPKHFAGYSAVIGADYSRPHSSGLRKLSRRPGSP